MSKRKALEHAHIQLQPATMRASIAADMDHPDTLARVREMDYPPPNLLMLNPANGHGHSVWQLANPVTFGDNSRAKPCRAFMDLQRQISTLYAADSGYSHFMVKTPGHPRWETIETRIPPYSLTELLDAMPAGIAKQAKERRVEGVGRHQTLFDVGRVWAYGEAKKAKRAGSFTDWQQRVTAEFLELNTFSSPLPASQVRSLARSVASWTWKNADRLNGSVMSGEKRSLIRSWEREPITVEERRERQAAGAYRTHAVRRNATYDAITAAIGVLAAQGIHNPSIPQLVKAAGVSQSAISRFRRSVATGSGEGQN